MKITVKVDGRSFIVQIGDINAKPVVAMVDGERFEVWPEDIQRVDMLELPETETASVTGPSTTTPAVAAAPVTASANSVLAPLPGVIESIAVEPGTSVNTGDTLCVIEAMKMKNTIRASRSGEIAAIKVAIGQHVQHGNILMEFAK